MGEITCCGQRPQISVILCTVLYVLEFFFFAVTLHYYGDTNPQKPIIFLGTPYVVSPFLKSTIEMFNIFFVLGMICCVFVLTFLIPLGVAMLWHYYCENPIETQTLTNEEIHVLQEEVKSRYTDPQEGEVVDLCGESRAPQTELKEDEVVTVDNVIDVIESLKLEYDTLQQLTLKQLTLTPSELDKLSFEQLQKLYFENSC